MSENGTVQPVEQRRLVRLCDFCKKPGASLLVIREQSSLRWTACASCVADRRMTRKSTPYVVSNLPNDKD